MNKIEEYKTEKSGLQVMEDLPYYAEEGWEAITDGDKERLKWLGVFFRRQTPGKFMMRVRIPNGMSNSQQLRVIAELGQEFGKGFVDITTRQQVQLRWFRIDQIQQIWDRLESVGLVSLQTGMDNIRNVVGCPMSGLAANELLDASPVVREYNDMFVGNPAYTNLPRKFNVTITGCMDNCTHGLTQDISLTPGVKSTGDGSCPPHPGRLAGMGRRSQGEPILGFNVAIGGKQGSGGFRPTTPLDVFVTPDMAAEVCNQITLIFRDHGPREARNKCRLAFLVDEWGPERFREELERRMGRTLLPAGRDMVCDDTGTDHMGIFSQKQTGLNAAGLVVPAGRISYEQLLEVARLSDTYGDGQVRLTSGQNLIIPNVPDSLLDDFKAEPLLAELRHDAPEIMKGLVSCTGIDYCHFALIETKERAVETAAKLHKALGDSGPVTMHWSGCPNACGNHTVADVGILGKRARLDGKVIDGVDVSLGKRFAGRVDAECLTNIPCEKLPDVLTRILTPTQKATA